MRILGIKVFGHDSAVFLIDFAHKEIFGISKERITRIKHDRSIVDEAYLECGEVYNNIDYIATSYESQLQGYVLETAIWDSLICKNFKIKYFQDLMLEKEIIQKNIFKRLLFISGCLKDLELLSLLFLSKLHLLKLQMSKDFFEKKIAQIFKSTEKIKNFNHHLCHAASAYFFSPYNQEKSVVFTLDGVGDGDHSHIYTFEGNIYNKIASSGIKNRKNITVSIGLTYSIFTKYLGFIPTSDEGKVEALAAYGNNIPSLYEQLKKIITINGLTFLINENEIFFLEMDNLKNFLKGYKSEDIAKTIQTWLENLIVSYLNVVYDELKIDILCLAGGVMANVILNLCIFEKTPFKKIYIFPAMNDDGTAAGAAALKAVELGYDISWLKDQHMPYWGPAILRKEIINEIQLQEDKIIYTYIGDSWPELAASKIHDGKIIAVVHGKMEYGPRALGNRSILANPCHRIMKDLINLKIKKRPSFQPFCPSVLEEERTRLFEKSYSHKYMATAFRLKEEFKSQLPCACHIDGTARPQFVEENDNSCYYKLLKELKRLNGYGVVINTSFNLHGRTIVRTARDAIGDFIDCGLDFLFLEGYMIQKK